MIDCVYRAAAIAACVCRNVAVVVTKTRPALKSPATVISYYIIINYYYCI